MSNQKLQNNTCLFALDIIGNSILLTMKIGVISDTHLNISDDRLEKIVEDHFHGLDLILHAGDIVDLEVLDVFKDKQVYAVSGNMDPDSVRDVFPPKRIVEIGGLHPVWRKSCSWNLKMLRASCMVIRTGP
jgi:Icc-related predicted phosphoesterase